MQKVPALRAMVRGEPLAEFDPAVAPLSDEIVFEKAYPSSFFGTALAPTLTAQGIDTVILVGCSTSGEIAGDQVHDHSISLAVARFEHSSLRRAFTPVQGSGDMVTLRQQLADALDLLGRQSAEQQGVGKRHFCL